MVLNFKLFEFQEEAVSYLFDETNPRVPKEKRIIFKSPTGSGKTIIMLSYIDKYIEFAPNSNTCFVWLTPGSGDLEEQSHKTMNEFFPYAKTQDLHEVLTQGFEENGISFINWEQINKKNNKSMTEKERENLSNQIASAHRKGMKFILIIDEEHTNNTNKTSDIINSFSAQHIIRTSATAKKNPKYLWYEISEEKVIEAGLIKKAMYINEGLSKKLIDKTLNYSNEAEILLKLANNKRKCIEQEYKKINKNIKPLVIIQFPSNSDNLITQVETKLKDMGFNYSEGQVAKWMANEKINISNLNTSSVSFLLMKQAISTGWDCPRSHILIKLRENMDENFEIQTIGRIRRMPEAMHYNIKELDSCYLYTLDKKYKEKVIGNIESAYDIVRLTKRKDVSNIKLVKENRDLDFQSFNLQEVFDMMRKHFWQKYSLTDDFEVNKRILKINKYLIDDKIYSKFIEDKFVTTKDFEDLSKKNFENITFPVDTHIHGIDLMHTIDSLKKILHVSHSDMRTLLEVLFAKNNKKKGKVFNLSKKEWYAFLINNSILLKEEMSELVIDKQYQLSGISIEPKTSIFEIPSEDYFKYDDSSLDRRNYKKNVYYGYNQSMTVNPLRSISEQLFEAYCENNPNIEWFYKNGDNGKDYFSIVYLDMLNNQWLFYPDYIINHQKKGLYIIETKGGEVKGISKNIDKKSQIKFDAFKKYADKYKINWGFVRDKNSNLYINDKEYKEGMNAEVWQPIEKYLN